MRKLVAGLLLAVTLTGCSATSALTGLVGSKPDVSAQVGAENTKQTVGLNNKVDSSTTNKTDVSDSNVGTLDTSSKKQVQTISTGTIQAERLQVVNNDSYSLIPTGTAQQGNLVLHLKVWICHHARQVGEHPLGSY